ncbi:MAG: acyl carrier protein [Oscillospiraceae bacterium]|nr:acyl carrier protein [Oscillospiraceae bacterium]
MSTFERLIKVFNTVFEDEISTADLKESASLREDMGINSIGMLYMAIALEEEFGIKFTNEDLQSLNTVADVIGCIEGKL